ncbi:MULTISPECIES: tRNA uridine-5-carboxymethylaminomethyl(34) synthesis enzyme MnmG [Anaerotruncus]|jgi:tRNA uridine 5-carboxymethylaminomethyl modification enzyme|uniref:tRNA uridine-5-carboxymethylaminomethyl(34) synthesis enzyme MnmG n=1 Tax=Anaerotruncus TaxID=244127 RepID=UPI000835873F|nr:MULTISPECIES: tRNA uridine-5-carboxymethylaminomethyl(34) synthesis enzyme MnmG [Anaerotruncus]RGX55695.1 tRNA uridine-5-carboxymethylaminomethyl(34) synthesis enzyme MnmG [Anaerotruncus sp. AF02-27]
MTYQAENYDVAVIGAGHAGIEAALAAARLGASTILFTISLDAIGNLPCNPSIGGTAKGHLVREIDALGGEMGKAADATFIQSRMLNRGKGPAVHSLRVQADRKSYHRYMKQILENQDLLDLKQAEIVEIRTENGRVSGVVTELGAIYGAKTVILATGTYLHGKIYVGEYTAESGPDGMHPARGLSDSLRLLGIPLRRFKTGTPARVDRRSIDFSKMEVQPGDEPITPFSFETDPAGLKNQSVCYMTYTNEKTHQVIRENLGRSPLYGGKIEGVGPRYCPSIEDKVVRFSDKPRHQLFIEPMGLDTNEMYLQGMSSSLPEEVQIKFYRTIEGFENLRVMRNAYAIEYDCVDPTCLTASLEFKSVKGLFGAGQFNGTSGYEEAAAQGLIAGVNAARQVQGKEPVVLDRASSYIGTLIDDLVIKGCNDPYRMMTSRSEYRLLLRQDNADARLTPLGYEIGLISETRYQRFLNKQRMIKTELARLEKTVVPPSEELNGLLVSRETAPLTTGSKLADLIRRPQLSYAELAPFDPQRPNLPAEVREQAEIVIKYEGYIKKQMAQIAQMRKLESRLLPPKLDYAAIGGLRLEAVEKLTKMRPANIGQASRISGVSPADISVLLIWLGQNRPGREGENP